MSEEQSPTDSGQRQVERDSQLSAMFDGELPGGECELLARRLAKDESLRAQWSRYSMIGAALRAERGVALHDRVAWRVQSAVAQEVTYGEGEAASTGRTAALVPADALRQSRLARLMRYSRPLAAAGIAASVATMSILWLRNQDPAASESVVASTAPTESIVLPAEVPAGASTMIAANPSAVSAAPSNGEPERYSTPAPSTQVVIAPPARLANYVVAHSEYSGPLSRRMALLGLVGSEIPAEVVEIDAADAAQPAPANNRETTDGP
jgi:sigma-E factor negative regulatory protein RseA